MYVCMNDIHWFISFELKFQSGLCKFFQICPPKSIPSKLRGSNDLWYIVSDALYICMIYIDLSVVSPEIPIRALQILAKLVVVTWHDGILWTQICPPKSTENIEVTRFEWSLSRLWSWCLVPKYFGFLCNFFLGWRGWLRLWVGDLLQRNCWLLVCLVHFFCNGGCVE